MLDNISVSTQDLREVKNDIISRYVADDMGAQTSIESAKKDVYAELKLKLKGLYPEKSNSDLDTFMEDIEDLPQEENLSRRIARLAVAKILEHNDMLSEAAYYRELANALPLTYYIDSDGSGDAGSDEEVIHENVRLGR